MALRVETFLRPPDGSGSFNPAWLPDLTTAQVEDLIADFIAAVPSTVEDAQGKALVYIRLYEDALLANPVVTSVRDPKLSGNLSDPLPDLLARKLASWQNAFSAPASSTILNLRTVL
jgi:hypothetical protein